MEKQFTALVGLDLSKMDDILIQNTLKNLPLLHLSKLYFIHVSEDLSLPEEIAGKYPDLAMPIDEGIGKGIEAKIKSFGIPDTLEIEINVKEGYPIETLLRWAKIKNVDYIIMGRKQEMDGSSTLAKKLAQKAPNSILFFTDRLMEEPVHKLLVPIDFSSHSELTLRRIQELVPESGGEMEIRCLHIYQVPTGYHKTGKSYEEFAEIMLQNAQKEYQQFIQKTKLPHYPCDFVLKDHQTNAEHILSSAQQQEADLIVMGSRGRTDSAAILLGSVAEKLVNINHEIPMLILKKRGENMGFLEALLKV